MAQRDLANLGWFRLGGVGCTFGAATSRGGDDVIFVIAVAIFGGVVIHGDFHVGVGGAASGMAQFNFVCADTT